MNVREQIKNGVLLMDGSMGSYLSTITGQSSQDCELAVLEQRDIVKDIHQQYLEAGSQAILTNTYNANRVFCHGNDTLVHQLIHEAVAVAREAAEGYDAEIFGDIGPIKGLENGQTGKEYSFVARQFIDAGIRNFVFETNSSAEGIPEAMRYIRENTEDAFIIVMFAVQADGYSLEGYYYRDLIRKITETGLADAVGLNCISGAREMWNLFDQMEHEEILYSFMPSAGSPIVVDNRVVYESDPQFFGRKKDGGTGGKRSQDPRRMLRYHTGTHPAGGPFSRCRYVLRTETRADKGKSFLRNGKEERVLGKTAARRESYRGGAGSSDGCGSNQIRTGCV